MLKFLSSKREIFRSYKMNHPEHDKKYWEDRYKNNQANWDLGCISTPLKEYIDQLTGKNIKILIPGCGNAYEAQYLHELGFNNVFVIDLVQQTLNNLRQRAPDFPLQQLITGDYFEHQGEYDLILEQTFVSSLEPRLRPAYAQKSYDLLRTGGKLAGVLFDFELDGGPPYGGSQSEYESYFTPLFNIRTFESCHNSIAARPEIEFFFLLERLAK